MKDYITREELSVIFQELAERIEMNWDGDPHMYRAELERIVRHLSENISDTTFKTKEK